jgi:hypothetical protein
VLSSAAVAAAGFTPVPEFQQHRKDLPLTPSTTLCHCQDEDDGFKHYRVLGLPRSASAEQIKQVRIHCQTSCCLEKAIMQQHARLHHIDLSASLNAQWSATIAKPFSNSCNLHTSCLLQAYRILARRLHPDKGGSSKSFAALQEAFEVLSDPKARKVYDALAADVRFRPGAAAPYSQVRARLMHPRAATLPRCCCCCCTASKSGCLYAWSVQLVAIFAPRQSCS